MENIQNLFANICLADAPHLQHYDDEEDELPHIEGDLGRALKWTDIDHHYLYYFTTGRSFKFRGYYQTKVEDFYYRIFSAYPEEVKTGRVPYDPNIHEVQTGCYEGQLDWLILKAEEERMGAE
jgi:hypothetical protein